MSLLFGKASQSSSNLDNLFRRPIFWLLKNIHIPKKFPTSVCSTRIFFLLRPKENHFYETAMKQSGHFNYKNLATLWFGWNPYFFQSESLEIFQNNNLWWRALTHSLTPSLSPPNCLMGKLILLLEFWCLTRRRKLHLAMSK